MGSRWRSVSAAALATEAVSLWRSQSPHMRLTAGKANRERGSFPRKPQRSTAQQTIARPMLRKPAVTMFSCQGNPVCPAPVTGERLAVPRTAASQSQTSPRCRRAPSRTRPPFIAGESLTSAQAAPKATRRSRSTRLPDARRGPCECGRNEVRRSR